VVRKISGAPRYVTRTVLASVAKLKGFDVKVHGFLYLISKPDIVAGTLVGTAAQMEAGLMPYMLGKAALRNM